MSSLFGSSLLFRRAYGHATSIHGLWNVSEVTARLANRGGGGGKENNESDEWPNLEKVPTFAWSYKSWADLIRYHVAQLRPKPQFAILNAGIWENKFYANPAVRQELAAALRQTGIVGIWKTTTYRNDTLPGNTRWTKTNDADPLMCQILPGCLNVSWTRNLDTSMWWDHHHMYEPVYRRMNEQLLDYLRSISWSSSSLQ